MIGQLERIVELQGLKDSPNYSNGKNMIAFTSGKGGAGKTVLSLNLAYQLSQQQKKVLFVDLDLNFSNAHVMMNIAPSSNLKNYFDGKSLLQNIIHQAGENFFLIAGNSGLMENNNSHREKIDPLLKDIKRLSADYDYVILDTGQINNNDQLKILLNSNFIFIVTTPEPTAVMDAYVVVKLLKQNNSNTAKQVIVNKCSNEEEAMLTFNNLNTATEHFLNEKLFMAGYINSSSDVHKSITKQKLFTKENPDFRVSNQISALTHSITKFTQMANIEHYNISKPSK